MSIMKFIITLPSCGLMKTLRKIMHTCGVGAGFLLQLWAGLKGVEIAWSGGASSSHARYTNVTINKPCKEQAQFEGSCKRDAQWYPMVTLSPFSLRFAVIVAYCVSVAFWGRYSSSVRCYAALLREPHLLEVYGTLELNNLMPT